MKITGPGSGLPPDAAGVDQAQGPGGKGFAEKVDKAAAGGAEGLRETQPPTGLASDIGADLAAGKITPQTAVQRVIDRIVDRQLGANAPTAVREKVEAVLRDALEEDPVLAEKVRALGSC